MPHKTWGGKENFPEIDQKNRMMNSKNFSIQPYQHPFRKQILTVWEKSVLATHEFLTGGDFLEIKKMVEAIDFNEFEVHCLLDDQKQVLGFLGVLNGKIEMLFLDPFWIGKGMGKLLLYFAKVKLNCKEVDVNEQNETARKLYEKSGFEVVGRSEKDGAGMDYPILHMKLKNPT
ncbi:GNAT family N-acetyltransferase [Algoriphagus sp.]|uniref:GNAT family N-acetyltransferase n=1 Tax=Algoriphagus sp. TaxID=1872435 RepID=UPI0027234F2C|nr:GNAT family N-acetyltransferase [Algoriphagus sp.]MDO8966488.1 GNAT family N-acetyltransferase [Algoriphagus sp.]MDP3201934.1 GNAT family N-acetyltransferase [Algoriphagus sp.]